MLFYITSLILTTKAKQPRAETTKAIKDKFSELGVEIPAEEIEERLDKLVTKFKVPVDEARRIVVNYFLKEHNIAKVTAQEMIEIITDDLNDFIDEAEQTEEVTLVALKVL